MYNIYIYIHIYVCIYKIYIYIYYIYIYVCIYICCNIFLSAIDSNIAKYAADTTLNLCNKDMNNITENHRKT